MHRTDILILGGGFAGINVAQKLKNFNGKVTLVDRTNHHVFQPLLYQVATSELVPNDMSTSFREILSSQDNTNVIMDTVTEINKEESYVAFANEEPIHFQKLVIALGARHSYFGHPEWEEFAPGLKNNRDAKAIHDRIILSFEKASICNDDAEKQALLNFIIVGGGPTGVELAGAIAEMTYSTFLKDYKTLDLSTANVYLVQSNERILPSFHPKLSEKSKHMLEKLGVTVLTKHHVTHIENGSVHVDEKIIPAYNVFWAAGVAASPILKTLNIEQDRQGRIVVQKDLSIENYPNIFVIGDAAHFKTEDGGSLPGVATTAIQQGKYLGKILRKDLPPEKRKPFKYFDKGSMATIGKLFAICETGKFRFSGFIGWLMWVFIHLLFLVSFKNRIAVCATWAMYLLKRSRGARLLSRPMNETFTHCGHDTFSVIDKKENK